MKAVRSMVALAATAVVGLISVNSAQAGYVEFSGTPGATVTLTETPPASGTYAFSEDFTWRSDGVGTPDNDPSFLGTWAAKTESYRAYQYDGIGDTVLLETSSQFINYRFIIPVDGANLSTVTLAANIRGSSVTARGLDWATNSYYTENSLFSGGSGFDPRSAVVPASELDTSTPGQVVFDLFFAQEGSGSGTGLDSFSVTATSVPEPASAAILGAGLLGLALRRRRRA